MKRTVSLILILAILLLCPVLLTGCGEQVIDEEYPVTVGGITVEKEPKSIVVLSGSLADIISYIGYDYKMVGRSDECDQEFLSIVPSVGGADSPDLNAIAGMNADLIIADSSIPADARGRIEAAGIPLVLLGPAADTDMLRERYVQLGTLLGGAKTGSKKGEKSYNNLMDLLAQFRTVTPDVVKTSVYLYLNDSGELCTFTKGSMEQQFFSYNGSINIFSNQMESVVNITELRMGSPTFIFYDDEAVIDTLRQNEKLRHLYALREKNICLIPRKNFSLYGTTCEQTVYEMVLVMNSKDSTPTDEP